MPKKKNIPIKYTSRDFESIKVDLIDHAQRYYADTYKDFSIASFGSLVLDSVSYVGDILSFYLDYQANESFMDTSIETDNVRRHASNFGYKYANTASSFGVVSLFIIVPSNSDGSAPDYAYIPTLKMGAEFKGGDNFYVLVEEVNFADPKNDIVAARFDSSTGQTTHFAIRAHGSIVSGEVGNITVNLSSESYQRFKRIRIGGTDVTGVINVFDEEGNEYFEVDCLTQEVVFLETTNRNAASDGVRSILKPFVAARRFTVEQDSTGTYLQFGNGSENDDQITGLIDPSRVSTVLHGRRNISSYTFDPTNLVKSGKLGISPSGKILTIRMRINDATQGSSAPAETITQVVSRDFTFNDLGSLVPATTETVRQTLEVSNPSAVIGSNLELTKEEVRQRAKSYYAMQGRAVTSTDYESLVYSMPPSFGSVRRCSVINDPSSASRRLTMYVVSNDSDGLLVETPQAVKNNIKNYISKYVPINDNVDIEDVKVINFGVEFTAISSPSFNASSVMADARFRIQDYFSDQLHIGEPIYLSEIYNVLSKTTGIIDVKKVKIYNKTGAPYSEEYMDIEEVLSRDGTYYNIPKNVILELKYPNSDIKGVIK
ncbi:MAG: hypothetical protein CBE07_003100 [Pelagibacteraceae bacterium TMED247]|nr:MAG: hypothetical protein CBE07_003100 [Pelagibacteraceae bacterium TMED247]|tara:strand:+ start:310 stop:2112 length:1803 start_codon:yes stop_codon:yes gene_type:complete